LNEGEIGGLAAENPSQARRRSAIDQNARSLTERTDVKKARSPSPGWRISRNRRFPCVQTAKERFDELEAWSKREDHIL
jgi:hypothetical protein